MPRSREELVKEYGHLLNHTGGNEPIALAERLQKEPRLSFTNLPVYTMAVAMESQFSLLEALDDLGRLA